MDHIEFSELIAQRTQPVDFESLKSELTFEQLQALPFALRNARKAGLISKRVVLNQDGTSSVLIESAS